jgi:hypothetical protein
MADNFEDISQARLIYQDGYRNAYLGEVTEPVVYGVQGVYASIMALELKKGQPSPLPWIISWRQSQAECTALLLVPCQGAKSM